MSMDIYKKNGAFETAHAFVARWEGGFSNHKADRGGYTAYGVSRKFLESLGKTKAGEAYLKSFGLYPVTIEKMKGITKETAMLIFRHEFWDAPKLSQIPGPIAVAVYDACVMSGAVQAVKMLQRAANRAIDSELAVDGIIGPRTIEELAQIDDELWQYVTDQFMDNRVIFYQKIVYNDETQKAFYRGWVNRARDLKKLLADKYYHSAIKKSDWE